MLKMSADATEFKYEIGYFWISFSDETLPEFSSMFCSGLPNCHVFQIYPRLIFMDLFCNLIVLELQP